ncbi:MAG: cytochrome b/b6 domain-containing protein [Peptococcaceae bacterium]
MCDKPSSPSTRPPSHYKLVELHPLAVRLLHWNQVFILLTLISCGLYIHHPGLFPIPLGTVKNIKSIGNFLLIANTMVYIYYSIITGHYHDLIFAPKDIKFLRGFFKYILFLKESPGYYGKYTPGQKITYTLWLLLILNQIGTGLMMFFPETFGYFIKLAGGLNKIRLIHYFPSWLFISTIPIHVYLAITENPAKLQSIFTGYARR